MSLNLSSATVVIGVLRVKECAILIYSPGPQSLEPLPVKAVTHFDKFNNFPARYGYLNCRFYMVLRHVGLLFR